MLGCWSKHFPEAGGDFGIEEAGDGALLEEEAGAANMNQSLRWSWRLDELERRRLGGEVEARWRRGGPWARGGRCGRFPCR